MHFKCINTNVFFYLNNFNIYCVFIIHLYVFLTSAFYLHQRTVKKRVLNVVIANFLTPLFVSVFNYVISSSQYVQYALACICFCMAF